VSFGTTHDYSTFEGYSYRDLLIYAPSNYVGVYTRERSNLAPLDKEGEICGDYNYHYGVWQSMSYHDSCWREDGVKRFIYTYQDVLNVFSGSSRDWYEVITAPEEIQKDPRLEKCRWQDPRLANLGCCNVY
jgi:hypothetical protein